MVIGMGVRELEGEFLRTLSTKISGTLARLFHLFKVPEDGYRLM
jgi:hypothetical protein